LVKTLLWNIT